MARGEAMARQNHLITVAELVPGQFNSSGSPVLGLDINTDGNGFKNLQRFIEHPPDGFNSIIGAALVGDEGEISGNFMPYYATLKYRLNAIANPPTTTILPDGRRMSVWKMPEIGRVNRETFSAFYGAEDEAVELRYGKIQQLSIECSRGGEVGGNLTMHFNNVRRNQQQLGSVARSEVKRVSATNITGNGTLTIPADPVTGLAGGTVTITPTETAATLDTKLSAVPCIANTNNVDVTGALAANAAIDWIDSGGSVNSVLNGAGAVVANSNVIIDNDNATNIVIPIAGFQTGYIRIDLGAARAFTKVRIRTGGGTLNGQVWVYPDSTYSYGNGTQVLNQPSAAFVANGYTEFTFASQTQRYVELRLVETAGATVNLRVDEIEVTGASASSSGEFLVTLKGTLANRDISDWSISGTGWATDTQQTGSDGSGPILLSSPYLEPTHILCYKASSYADLQSIKMGITAPEGAAGPDLADAHIIKTVQANAFTADGLVNAVYYEDRQTAPAGHVDGETNITTSITLPKDKNGRCEEIYGTEGGCSVQPWYLRQAYKCGPWELWIDVYNCRNAQPDFPVDNNVAQRQFPLRRVYNPNGSVIFTLIEPIS